MNDYDVKIISLAAMIYSYLNTKQLQSEAIRTEYGEDLREKTSYCDVFGMFISFGDDTDKALDFLEKNDLIWINRYGSELKSSWDVESNGSFRI